MAREVIQNSFDAGVADKVQVEFTLGFLETTALRAALDSAISNDLLEHIEAIAKDESLDESVTRPAGAALDYISQGRLPFMKITETGTVGLKGTDDDEIDAEDNHLHHLTRAAFKSGKRDKKGSLGSFGLGKQVLWKASLMSTVLFSSLPEDSDVPLFIGVTHLASHRLGNAPFTGAGYFGSPVRTDVEPPLECAADEAHTSYALRGPEARQLAADMGIERDNTGTTILIPGFRWTSTEGERDGDVADDLSTYAVDLAREIARTFWPSLLRENLRVSITVVGGADGDESFDVAEFVSQDAYKLYDAEMDWREIATDDKLEGPDDRSVREIDVAYPGSEELEVAGFSAPARLIAVGLPDDGETRSKIYWRRGGMVIFEKNIPWQTTCPTVAISIVGGDPDLAADFERDGTIALGRLLRASEPQQHNKWDPNEERLLEKFGLPGKRTLDEFMKQALQQCRAITEQDSSESPEPPDALVKSLSFTAEQGNVIAGGDVAPGRPRRGRRNPTRRRGPSGTRALVTASATGRTWDGSKLHMAFSVTVSDETKTLVPIRIQLPTWSEFGSSRHLRFRAQAEWAGPNAGTSSTSENSADQLVIPAGTEVQLQVTVEGLSKTEATWLRIDPRILIGGS